MVLKRAPADEPIAWRAALFEAIADCAAFRVARSVCGAGGDWIVDGWAATTWLDGEHQHGRWEDVLAASRAFHDALCALDGAPPESFGIEATPWQVGAAVAWGERPPRRGIHPAVASALEALRGMLEARWTGPPPQIIHGDFGGNVLFSAAGLAPAVIDFSPLLRPAPFADAIVIVDAIAWWSASPDLAARFMREREYGAQALARAVAYRLVVTDHLWAASDPRRADAEVAGFLPAIAVITGG